MKLESIEDILVYWFGNEYYSGSAKLHDLEYIRSRFPLWFGSNNSEFNQIQLENNDLIEKVIDKDRLRSFINQSRDDEESSLSSSFNEFTAKELLAAIIVLDQFSRCIYRGTARAFQYDNFAIIFAKEVLRKNWYYDQFSAIERLFIQLPFAHAEDIHLQELAVELGNTIGRGETQDIVDYFHNLPGFPDEHYEVIKRFGRFPSRNHAVSRETTQAEQQWLESEECPGWAKSQMKK